MGGPYVDIAQVEADMKALHERSHCTGRTVLWYLLCRAVTEPSPQGPGTTVEIVPGIARMTGLTDAQVRTALMNLQRAGLIACQIHAARVPSGSEKVGDITQRFGLYSFPRLAAWVDLSEQQNTDRPHPQVIAREDLRSAPVGKVTDHSAECQAVQTTFSPLIFPGAGGRRAAPDAKAQVPTDTWSQEAGELWREIAPKTQVPWSQLNRWRKDYGAEMPLDILKQIRDRGHAPRNLLAYTAKALRLEQERRDKEVLQQQEGAPPPGQDIDSILSGRVAALKHKERP